MYSPAIPPLNIPEQQIGISEPLDSKLTRDSIYAGTLVNQIPLLPEAQASNIESQIIPPGTQLPRVLDKNDIYNGSNYPNVSSGAPIGPSVNGNDIGNIPTDILEQVSRDASLNTKLTRDDIYRDIRGVAIDQPLLIADDSIIRPIQPNTQAKNILDKVLPPGTQLPRDLNKNDIYGNDVNKIPSDITDQLNQIQNNIASQPKNSTVKPLTREEIYKGSDYPTAEKGSAVRPFTDVKYAVGNDVNKIPDDISKQLNNVRSNPDFIPDIGHDESHRKEIYEKARDFTQPNINSNIGRWPGSNLSKGDENVKNGKPPAPPLNIKQIAEEGLFPHKVESNGSPLQQTREEIYKDIRNGIPLTPDGTPGTPLLRDELTEQTYKQFVPADQDIKNNLYNNSPVSFIKGGPYGIFPGPTKYFDIFAIAHWVRNVGSEVFFLPKFQNAKGSNEGTFQGPVRSNQPGGPNGSETLQKSITFIATQFLLASLNKGDPQAYGVANLIYNPLSILSAFLPARGISPSERPTIGNMISTYKTNLAASVVAGGAPLVGERLLLIRKGIYAEVAPIQRLNQLRSPIPIGTGFIGNLNGGTTETLDDESPLRLSKPTTIEMITNGNTDTIAAKLGVHTNLYNEERKYGLENAIYPLEKLESKENEVFYPNAGIPGLKNLSIFDGKPAFGSGLLASGRDMTFIAKPKLQYSDKIGISSKDLPDNVDVAFDAVDEEDGFHTGPIDDDENYMPFMFEDLRQPDDLLYFRAFLKSGLGESFSPDWSEDSYYGRVDPVPTYMGTRRSIDLSFDVVAWGPKDLGVMYKKLQKLQSMVYPLYDDKGFLKTGPIIRMRIGDLFCGAENKGLPGYITSLDFSYDDTTWNIKKDFKVPRKVIVSLGFTVIHEHNPGLYKDGNKHTFGTAKVTQEGSTIKVATPNISDIRKIFKTVRGN